MSPAFDSTTQAASFALLLLFLLAAPWLAAERMLPGPNDAYSSECVRCEKFPWVQKFIFEETNDIDIAFIGSSHMLMAIDTAYVQQQLDAKLGRKSVVRSICWLGSGFDVMYFMTKDLLAHRHVKTLVFYDDFAVQSVHWNVPSWFLWGEDNAVISGLPALDQPIYYFAAVIKEPRQLLANFAPTLPYDAGTPAPRLLGRWQSASPENNLGSMGARLGFEPVLNGGTTNFTPFSPHTDATPGDVCLYSAQTAAKFDFSNKPLPAGQLFFARQFASMAKSHGCNLAVLYLPSFGERNSNKIPQSRNWTELLQTNVAILGIPAARLFNGLSEAEIKLLYFDNGHLNENGQKYFTPLATPALLDLYEGDTNH